jgi:hypothetical protein
MSSIHLVVCVCTFLYVFMIVIRPVYLYILYFHIWYTLLYDSGSNLFPTRVDETVVGGPKSRYRDKVWAPGFPSRAIDRLCDPEGSSVLTNQWNIQYNHFPKVYQFSSSSNSLITSQKCTDIPINHILQSHSRKVLMY